MGVSGRPQRSRRSAHAAVAAPRTDPDTPQRSRGHRRKVAPLGGCALVAGCLAGWLAGTHGAVWAAAAVWLGMGVWVSVTDIRTALVPRRVVWPAGAAVAGLLVGAALRSGQLGRVGWALAGAASLGALLSALYARFPGRFGYGDVRLIVANGLLAGWWGPAWSWWALGAGAAAAWPAAAVAMARRGRSSQLRWAPWLVVGAAAVIGGLLWAHGPVGA